MTQSSANRGGKVFLVGAGPGNPGLITVRGTECLAEADLVLYDYLVNPGLLRYSPDTSERACVGHPHSGYAKLQEDIAARDKADSERAISPLVQAADAVLLDTTGLSIEQVVEKILGMCR